MELILHLNYRQLLPYWYRECLCWGQLFVWLNYCVSLLHWGRKIQIIAVLLPWDQEKSLEKFQCCLYVGSYHVLLPWTIYQSKHCAQFSRIIGLFLLYLLHPFESPPSMLLQEKVRRRLRSQFDDQLNNWGKRRWVKMQPFVRLKRQKIRKIENGPVHILERNWCWNRRVWYLLDFRMSQINEQKASESDWNYWSTRDCKSSRFVLESNLRKLFDIYVEWFILSL